MRKCPDGVGRPRAEGRLQGRALARGDLDAASGQALALRRRQRPFDQDDLVAVVRFVPGDRPDRGRRALPACVGGVTEALPRWRRRRERSTALGAWSKTFPFHPKITPAGSLGSRTCRRRCAPRTPTASASIVLTRAAEYNTITPALRDELAAAIDDADADRDVRVILLRAEGRAFCAGYGARLVDRRAGRSAASPDACGTRSPTCA